MAKRIKGCVIHGITRISGDGTGRMVRFYGILQKRWEEKRNNVGLLISLNIVYKNLRFTMIF